MPSHISPTIPWQGHKQEGKRWKQIGLLMEVCFIRKKRLPRSPLAIGQNWITSSPLDQSKGNKLSYLDFGQSWLNLFIWAIVTQTQLGFNSEEKRNWGGNNSQIFFPVLTVLLTPSYIFPTARWAALPHCPTVASNSAIQEMDYCSYPLTLSPLFAFPDFSSGNFIHTLWRLWTLGSLLMPSLMPSLSVGTRGKSVLFVFLSSSSPAHCSHSSCHTCSHAVPGARGPLHIIWNGPRPQGREPCNRMYLLKACSPHSSPT